MNKEKLAQVLERLVKALGEIASYDLNSAALGICPYGCDCPSIARAALKLVPANFTDLEPEGEGVTIADLEERISNLNQEFGHLYDRVSALEANSPPSPPSPRTFTQVEIIKAVHFGQQNPGLLPQDFLKQLEESADAD